MNNRSFVIYNLADSLASVNRKYKKEKRARKVHESHHELAPLCIMDLCRVVFCVSIYPSTLRRLMSTYPARAHLKPYIFDYIM